MVTVKGAIDWPLVETRDSWDDWLQMQRERDEGCQFERPMQYCKLCGTYMHCKNEEEGPWRQRRRDDDGH